MPVLIFIDQSDNTIKKTTPEVITYGAKLAAQLGTTAEGVLLGTIGDDIASLGKYGVTKIHHVADEKLNHPDGQVYTKIIAEVATVNRRKGHSICKQSSRKSDRTTTISAAESRVRYREPLRCQIPAAVSW